MLRAFAGLCLVILTVFQAAGLFCAQSAQAACGYLETGADSCLNGLNYSASIPSEPGEANIKKEAEKIRSGKDMNMENQPELISLTVEGVTLDSPFSPEIKEYWGTVEYDVASVKISAVASGGCEVKCSGGVKTEEGFLVNLAVGRNDIEISAVNSNGISSITKVVLLRRQDENLLYNEELRPQFHFTQYQYSLNDPNGLVYNAATGEYHMYFQSDEPFHTQYAVEGNSKSWGHAVSRDLVNWEMFDRVIEPDENGKLYGRAHA